VLTVEISFLMIFYAEGSLRAAEYYVHSFAGFMS